MSTASASSPATTSTGTVEAAAPPPTLVSQLGALALEMAGTARGIYSVLVKTLYYVFKGTPQPGAITRQMLEIGNRSLLFLMVVMGFLGMILVYQTGLQTQRVVPDSTMLGATYLELLVREVAPSICALMLATRVGAGIAAEVGSMVVTEQVDALRMCAADPIDYLIKPRFIACTIMTFFLVLISGTVAWYSGMLTGNIFFGINPNTYSNYSLLDRGDVVTGLIKCFAYGAAIPIVSGHSGLSAFGGSEGVGWAATRAVVNTSLAVIILNFFISAACYVAFG